MRKTEQNSYGGKKKPLSSQTAAEIIHMKKLLDDLMIMNVKSMFFPINYPKL